MRDGVGVTVLEKMVRESLTENVTFEPRGER